MSLERGQSGVGREFRPDNTCRCGAVGKRALPHLTAERECVRKDEQSQGGARGWGLESE